MTDYGTLTLPVRLTSSASGAGFFRRRTYATDITRNHPDITASDLNRAAAATGCIAIFWVPAA